jgi:hypothetical protein
MGCGVDQPPSRNVKVKRKSAIIAEITLSNLEACYRLIFSFYFKQVKLFVAKRLIVSYFKVET